MYSLEICVLLTCAIGPRSHVTLSARRPATAVENRSATTAMPWVTWTTCLTPGMALAAVASKLCTLPPETTGARSIEATSMPGTCTSMP